MLSEPQILRYARQILLPQVGGKGQEALLQLSVKLSGQGAALMSAAAYLAAAGSAIVGRSRQVASTERGFLFPANDVGRDASAELLVELRELNPDAAAREPNAALGELPAAFTVEGPWVAIGWEAGAAVVLFRAMDGCRDCFERTAAEQSNGPAGPTAVVAGSIAAVMLQRIALGIAEEPLGGLKVASTGVIGSAELRRCPKHS